MMPTPSNTCALEDNGWMIWSYPVLLFKRHSFETNRYSYMGMGSKYIQIMLSRDTESDKFFRKGRGESHLNHFRYIYIFYPIT